MKKSLIIGLQTAIVLIGIVIFYGLIRFPAMEGRAKNLDLIGIYSDPFILCIYAISIVFFIGLYHVFQFLGQVKQDNLNSKKTVNHLKSIKYCGLFLLGSIVLVGLYILLFHPADDDPAGFLALCIFFTLIIGIITFATSKFEKKFSSNIIF